MLKKKEEWTNHGQLIQEKKPKNGQIMDFSKKVKKIWNGKTMKNQNSVEVMDLKPEE